MKASTQMQNSPTEATAFDEVAFWDSCKFVVEGTRSELLILLQRVNKLDRQRGLKRVLSVIMGLSLVVACLGLVVYASVESRSIGQMLAGGGGALVAAIATLWMTSNVW